MFGRKKTPTDTLQAEARVLRMAPTAKAARRPDKLDVDYEFRVELAGGRDVDFVQVVPHDKIVAMGQRVPVLVSTSDPSAVSIDFSRIADAGERAEAAAAAAESGDAAAIADALGFELRDPSTTE